MVTKQFNINGVVKIFQCYTDCPKEAGIELYTIINDALRNLGAFLDNTYNIYKKHFPKLIKPSIYVYIREDFIEEINAFTDGTDIYLSAASMVGMYTYICERLDTKTFDGKEIVPETLKSSLPLQMYKHILEFIVSHELMHIWHSHKKWKLRFLKKEPPFFSFEEELLFEKVLSNISYDLSNCKTIRDIVETATIFNSYVDGKGQLFGRSLGDDVDFSNVSKYDEDSLLFWEKLLKLEEVLNIQFTPQKKDIEFATICLVEEIYQNLINNLPIRSDARIESVDGDWNMVDDNKIINSIGENAFFEFEATTHIELFGCSFDLPCLVAIINAKVSNFEKKGSKYTLYLDDESSEKRMFLSKLRFITEEDLKKFRDSDHDKIITMLHDAQRASEYI